MPTSPQPDMITNTLTGYWLAWVNRGQLLAVLVPVMVPVQVVAWLSDLVTVGADSPIINGAYGFAGDQVAVGLIKLVLLAACWMWVLASAFLVLAGALRGAGVIAFQALRTVLKRLPYLFAGLMLACLVLGAIVFVGAFIGSAFGPLGVPIFIATLVFTAVLAARMLLGVAATMLGGSAWALSHKRLWVTAGPLVLGGAVIPAAAYSAMDAAAAEWPMPFVWDFATTILLSGTIAVQAAILALVYLQPRREGDPGQVADLDAVDARLQPLTGTLRRGRLAMVSLIVPALIAATLTDANPMDSPRMQAGPEGPFQVAAVAWPPGQHPIYVSYGTVHYCQDDLCQEQVARSGGPVIWDNHGVVGFGADDTVVTASLTGSIDNGGPFIEYSVCAEADGCRDRAWIPVRASAEEPFSFPQLAVAPAPDGGIWFGLAKPPGYDLPGYTFPDQDLEEGMVRFEFLYCPDFACEEPQRYPVAKVEGWLDSSGEQYPSQLSVGEDGRPSATFEFGHIRHTITCDLAGCANPKLIQGDPQSVSSNWFSGSDAPETTVTTPNGQSYMVYATRFHPAGIHVTFGDPPQYWQYRLRYCGDSRCVVPRDIPLDVVKGPPPRVSLAVAADGRILILRPDRTLFVPSLSGS